MNYKNLHSNVDFLGSSGVILSHEQKAALQTSLIVVQHDENFSDLFFWGKILGLGGDYFLVQGIYEGSVLMRKTLYSRDCVSWVMLTPVTEEIIDKASIIKGRFSGDPSHKFEMAIASSSPNEEPTEEEEESYSNSVLETEKTESSIILKEEDRLAAVVASIDQDAFIVPRGAYVRKSTGKIYRNRTYEGLSLQEAGKLQYYFHFRTPILLTHKTLLQRANLDSSIDFMDNIEEDTPAGLWSLQMERGGGVVILKHLEWLGYTFYHRPGTTEFGSAYFGTGERNIDLPFML